MNNLELERKEIICFKIKKDRDFAEKIFQENGFFTIKLGELLLGVSKNLEEIEKMKQIEIIVRKTLDKMENKNEIKRIGNEYIKN